MMMSDEFCTLLLFFIIYILSHDSNDTIFKLICAKYIHARQKRHNRQRLERVTRKWNRHLTTEGNKK